MDIEGMGAATRARAVRTRGKCALAPPFIGARPSRPAHRGEERVTDTLAETSPGALQHYVLRASADPVKRDLELIHTTCDSRVCDAEHDDSLDVLVHVAGAHAASCNRP